MPKQIEGMQLSFKRRTAANHTLRKTGFSRSPPVHRTNPEGQLRVESTRCGNDASLTRPPTAMSSSRRLTSHPTIRRDDRCQIDGVTCLVRFLRVPVRAQSVNASRCPNLTAVSFRRRSEDWLPTIIGRVFRESAAASPNQGCRRVFRESVENAISACLNLRARQATRPSA